MAKYIDADILRKEIEKKSYEEQGFSSGDSEYGYRSCARDLLAFIDTLSEEPDKRLDEAAHRYAWKKQEHHIDFDGDEYLDYGPRYDAFKAGAKWQKTQMMKEAVEGEITKDIHNLLHVKSGPLPMPSEFKFGDKVKIIIIKDDDQR